MHDNRQMEARITFTMPPREPPLPIPGTRFGALPFFTAAIPPEISGTRNTVEISLRFRSALVDWEMWALGVFRADGEPPIAPDSLRSIAPTEVMRLALQNVGRAILHHDDRTVTEVWDAERPMLHHARDEGPTSANLAAASEIYTVAQLLRFPPVVKVADMFGLPQRTATHWVKLARERGHLSQGGKDGAATDSDQ